MQIFSATHLIEAPLLSAPAISDVSAHPLHTFVSRRSRFLGLSQTELAARAEMTRAYLHRLITGGVPNPGVLTLQRLALALQVSPTALLRLFVGTPQSSGSVQVRHDSPHDLRDAMAFLADVTVPDHSVVLPGERFTKIWAIQNVGEVAWPARQLVRQDEALVVARRERSGVLTPLLDAHLNSLERVLSVPPVPVGQVQELRVDFVAPQESCTVASIWRLQSLEGQACYLDNAFVQVIVTVVAG